MDVHQFLTTIYRYIQLGVHIKAFYSKEYGKFHRELDEVSEFYVDDNNEPKSRIIYQKIFGKPIMCRPSDHLIEYLENQNIDVSEIIKDLPKDLPLVKAEDENITSDNNNEDGDSSSNLVDDNKADNTNDVIPDAASNPIVADNSSNQSNEVVANNQNTVSTDTKVVEQPVIQAVAQPEVVEVVNEQKSIPPMQEGTNNVQLSSIPIVQSVIPQQVVEQPINPVLNNQISTIAKLDE